MIMLMYTFSSPRRITCTIRGELDAYSVTLTDETRRREIAHYALQWHPSSDICETLRLLAEDSPIPDGRLIDLGRALYQSLFHGPGEEVHQQLIQSRDRHRRVQFRLCIEPEPLACLPWEALHDGLTLISAHSDFTVFRTSGMVRQLEGLQVNGPLRILFASASPADLPALDTDHTVAEIRRLLVEHTQKSRVIFDTLPHATIAELHQALLRNYHIVCFAGHGEYDALYLDDGQGDVIDAEQGLRLPGDSQRLTTEELGRQLEGKATRLVVLSACRTSAAPEQQNKPLAGFAEQLVTQAKIPAVVAMQTPISDLQANQFTAHFFASLAAYHPVDMAVAEARKSLVRYGAIGRDVIAPLLWLQSRNGALFRHTMSRTTLMLVSALLVVFLVAGLLLVRASDIGQARALAQQAEQELAGPFPERGVALALLAINEHAAIPEAEAVLYESVWQSPARLIFSGVGSVSFSPDESLILSQYVDPFLLEPASEEHAADARFLQLTDAATGEIHASFPIEAEFTDEALFRPDGAEVAVIDGPRVRGWDLNTHEQSFVIDVEATGIAYSPDSKKLVVSTEHTVTLWDLTQLTQLHRITTDERLQGVAYRPDGAQFAAVSYDGTVIIWDARTGERVRLWDANAESSSFSETILDFSPDSRLLLTAGDSRTTEPIQIWEVATGQRVMGLNGHNRDLTTAAFSPDGTRIVTAAEDNLTIVWDARTGQQLAQVRGHRTVRLGVDAALVQHARLSRDNSRLITSGLDMTVRVWDLTALRETLVLPDSHSDTFVFSPDGTLIAVSTNDHAIRLWDLRRKEQIGIIPTDNHIETLAFSPDGQRLAGSNEFSSNDPTLVWDITTRDVVFTSTFAGAIVDFSPDGELLLVSNIAGHFVLDADTGEYRFSLGYGGDSNAQFTADGQFVITEDDNNDLSVWSVATQQQVGVIETGDHNISNMALSADGRMVATSSWDDTVRLWDITTGSELLRISTADGVGCIALSPDGQRLAATLGSQVVVWDTMEGKELVRLNGNQCVQFSPDGRSLASSGADDTLRIWPLWSEPLTLEEYAVECCLVRPIDQYDIEQLAVLQANPLWAMAGRLPLMVFFPGLITLYIACVGILLVASRMGRPIPADRPAPSRWRRLGTILGRALLFLASSTLIAGASIALLMFANPASEHELISLLIVLLFPILASGIVYAQLHMRRLQRFVWLRLLVGAIVWGGMIGGLGGGIAAWLSSPSWTTRQPIIDGLFTNLWQLQVQLRQTDDIVLLPMIVLAYAAIFSLCFMATTAIGCLTTLIGSFASNSYRRLRQRRQAHLSRTPQPQKNGQDQAPPDSTRPGSFFRIAIILGLWFGGLMMLVMACVMLVILPIISGIWLGMDTGQIVEASLSWFRETWWWYPVLFIWCAVGFGIPIATLAEL
jgi:WD40 repeat protein